MGAQVSMKGGTVYSMKEGYFLPRKYPSGTSSVSSQMIWLQSPIHTLSYPQGDPLFLASSATEMRTCAPKVGKGRGAHHQHHLRASIQSSPPHPCLSLAGQH